MEDIVNINIIFLKARKFMQASGNPDQWGNNRPTYESVITDIESERMSYYRRRWTNIRVFLSMIIQTWIKETRIMTIL